jgi:hypothetical protein
MIKFPSESGDGMVPSGNSVAVTYPGVCGSRVGGAGRFGRAVIFVAVPGVWASAGFNSKTAQSSTVTQVILTIFIFLILRRNEHVSKPWSAVENSLLNRFLFSVTMSSTQT